MGEGQFSSSCNLNFFPTFFIELEKFFVSIFMLFVILMMMIDFIWKFQSIIFAHLTFQLHIEDIYCMQSFSNCRKVVGDDEMDEREH